MSDDKAVTERDMPLNEQLDCAMIDLGFTDKAKRMAVRDFLINDQPIAPVVGHRNPQNGDIVRVEHLAHMQDPSAYTERLIVAAPPTAPSVPNLLPCPFCGVSLTPNNHQGDLHVRRYGTHYDHPRGVCYLSDSEVSPSAVEEWNMRAFASGARGMPHE